MIDFPIEFSKCTMEEYYANSSYYRIVLDMYMSYLIEIRVVIIRDPETRKFNLYVIDYCSEALRYKNADQIVLNLTPATLEEAKKGFPLWVFTEENYGF